MGSPFPPLSLTILLHVSDTGYQCGECPLGFSGDGEECDSDIKCVDEPCFPSMYKTQYYIILFIHYSMILDSILGSARFQVKVCEAFSRFVAHCNYEVGND